MQAEHIRMIGRAACLGVADNAICGQNIVGIRYLNAIRHPLDLIIGEQDHLVAIVEKGLQAKLFQPAQLRANPK